MNHENRTFRDTNLERGDTLIEVLIALTVSTITVLAMLTAFGSAIASSTVHKSLAAVSALLRSYAEVETFQVQLQPSPLYSSCASSYSFSNLPSVTTGYSVAVSSIRYWNGVAFVSSCTAGSTNPQLITLTATGPNSVSKTLSFVVANFNYSATQASPLFTSAATFTAAVGASFSFMVQTTGSPSPALTETLSMPTGVTFVDNGDGTGTLSGTSSVATGTYTLTFRANNSVGTAPTQSFTLKVLSLPTFTSAATTTWTHGIHSTFTVSATSSPSPSFSVLSTLPTGVTFVDNGNGTGTLTGSTSTVAGTYTISLSANNGPYNTLQTFTLRIT